MKKFLLAAAATAAVAVSATPAAAQNYGQRGPAQASRQVDRHVDRQVTRNVRVNRHVQVDRRVNVNRHVQASPQRRWQRGERFDRSQARNYQVIQRHDRLYAAPRGHQWVRSGDDAVLVAIGSGIIGALIANLF